MGLAGAISKPKFLCIGAQKAGTTWLHSNLKRHPEIWMPPIKELHYFDRSPQYPSPNLLSVSSLVERAGDPKWVKSAVERIGKICKEGDYERAAWFGRYYFSDYTDEWYVSLFEWAGDKVCGEMTPAYAMLTAPDVERMHALLPDVKIIFLLRDPVERAWSYCRHIKKIYGKIDLDDSGQVIDCIESPAQETRGDYLRTIDTYLQYFRAENCLLAFYDAIVAQPNSLMGEVLKFLKVENTEFYSTETQTQRINASPEKEASMEVRAYLNTKYQPMKRELARRFGSYCRAWVEEGPGDAGVLPAVIHP